LKDIASAAANWITGGAENGRYFEFAAKVRFNSPYAQEKLAFQPAYDNAIPGVDVTHKYRPFALARSLHAAAAGLALAGMLAACARAPVQDAPAAPSSPRIISSTMVTSAPEPAAAPTPVRVAEPQMGRYVVKPGDTLWGIANRFLADPWQWPEVWVTNPDVANPHLIYPGDVLTMVWRDGVPRVQHESLDTTRLGPRIRELPLDEAIPTIPLEAIREFLNGPRLVDAGVLDAAPYVVEFDSEHLIGPDDVGLYARRIDQDDPLLAYTVVHIGDTYRDPDNGRIIGYEAIPTADATRIRHNGDITTLSVQRGYREVRIGDRLLPREPEYFNADFFPHPPIDDVNGRIIAVFGGVTQIGQYNIVTLNRGSEHGLTPGHVLDVYQAGRRVRDPESRFGRVQLPSEFAGQMMVFKVYPGLSHGLIMDARRPMFVLDEIRKPTPQN
jgi:hypothetical protein